MTKYNLKIIDDKWEYFDLETSVLTGDLKSCIKVFNCLSGGDDKVEIVNCSNGEVMHSWKPPRRLLK
jgi:hypothetical protein